MSTMAPVLMSLEVRPSNRSQRVSLRGFLLRDPRAAARDATGRDQKPCIKGRRSCPHDLLLSSKIALPVIRAPTTKINVAR